MESDFEARLPCLTGRQALIAKHELKIWNLMGGVKF
jgi:hypothetical protein